MGPGTESVQRLALSTGGYLETLRGCLQIQTELNPVCSPPFPRHAHTDLAFVRLDEDLCWLYHASLLVVTQNYQRAAFPIGFTDRRSSLTQMTANVVYDFFPLFLLSCKPIVLYKERTLRLLFCISQLLVSPLSHAVNRIK